MYESVTFIAPNVEVMRFIAASLVGSLYKGNQLLFLSGELGAGKTTFMQGFIKAMGFEGRVQSPTFALENRYDTPAAEVVHIDLYRLENNGPADAFLEQATEEFKGMICVEWPERLVAKQSEGVFIQLREAESTEGRQVDIRFEDNPLPSDNQIVQWRQGVMLQPHIIDHCETVALVAGRLADHLLEYNIVVRKQALVRAAKVHDLLRFVDFLDKPLENEYPKRAAEELQCWYAIAEHFKNQRHEEAVSNFLAERGFSMMADIVREHGPYTGNRQTIEQELLYYADKRVSLDKIVSLDERRDDLNRRYNKGGQSQVSDAIYNEAKRIERKLGLGEVCL